MSMSDAPLPPSTPSLSVPTGQPVGSSHPSGPAATISTRSIVALILGILSLVCCGFGFFAGIPAIILGRTEIKTITEGQGAESSKTLAKIGMVLGIIGTIFSALIALVYIILIALGISAGLMEHRGTL